MLKITLSGANGERVPFMVRVLTMDGPPVKAGVGAFFSKVIFMNEDGREWDTNVITPHYDEPLSLLDILPDAIEELTVKQCGEMGIISSDQIRDMKDFEQVSR